MKVMTILGTRPEIIRLSRVIEKLDVCCEHLLLHTGQNYDPSLSDVFFEQLGVRRPDYALGVRGDTFGEQVGRLLSAVEKVMIEERPDGLLVLGDTNSALSSIVAKRIGIPVYHMEAGNRCYDDRVPEEINRRIVDHCSDVLMPYTERSRSNLLREGIPGQRVYVTGNPIYEIINHYESQIARSEVLDRLGLQPKSYFLVTLHRAENVDVERRLREITAGMVSLQEEHGLPLIVSTHPRTRDRMNSFGIHLENEQVHFLEPFGFFDFITLERNAYCVLSDSGTVQEECAIMEVANVTLRDVTERPETIECGSNILSGSAPGSIIMCVRAALGRKGRWQVPAEYLVTDVSDTVANIVLGYRICYQDRSS